MAAQQNRSGSPTVAGGRLVTESSGGRRPALPATSFLVDENVASLVRRLRWLGFDTVADPAADDAMLVEWAEREKRVLLTRDRGILLRRPVALGKVQALFIESDNPWQQLAQVVRDTGIDPVRNAFSRCVRCNVPLEESSREEAAGVVPPHVGKTQVQFTHCPSCGRYFWRGTHWNRMRKYLESHLDPVWELPPAATSIDSSSSSGTT
jgi:uncharacterized protein with PIN domain